MLKGTHFGITNLVAVDNRAILLSIQSNHMIQSFTFSWNGRCWNGYFNALANESVIAHFEDESIRDTIGQTLIYSKTEKGAVSCPVKAHVQQSHLGIYDAIQKGVEVRLGQSLHQYLN